MLLAVMMLLMPMQAFAAESVYSIRARNAECSAKNAFQSVGLQIVELANARIDAIINESVYAASMTSDPALIHGIAMSMIARTTVVSQAAQLAASLCGVVTVCDWVPVEIGGQTFYVDPLRVVLV